MVFWIAVAVLAAVVTYVVTRPLTHESRESVTGGREADLAVYKDQLAEIDADVARGALTEDEAQSARTEVSRRLLRAADSDAAPKGKAALSSGTAKPLYVAVSLLLPIASLGLYLLYGAPGLPGQPLHARLTEPVANAQVTDLIAKVEEQLRAHPDDGKGWEVIGPVYFSQARFADAANAYANAIRVLGETSPRLQRFANSRVRAENGLVPDDARKALLRALQLDPAQKEPLIWLAMAKEQDGNTAGAIEDYKALLASATDASAWRSAVSDRLKMLEARLSGAAPVTPAPQVQAQAQAAQPQAPATAQQDGPSAPAAAAVGAMAPEQRAAFINQMVANLAERLKTNSTDLEGWLKLVRAYKVLGRDSDATAALTTARKSLASDEKALGALDGLAKELGLGG